MLASNRLLNNQAHTHAHCPKILLLISNVLPCSPQQVFSGEPLSLLAPLLHLDKELVQILRLQHDMEYKSQTVQHFRGFLQTGAVENSQCTSLCSFQIPKQYERTTLEGLWLYIRSGTQVTGE